MDFPMRHLVLSGLLLILALAPKSLPAQEADPIREALTRAIQDFRADRAYAKAVVMNEFDRRIKATAEAGNFDAAQKLVAEKKAFDTDGTLPGWTATIPAIMTLPKALAEVDTRLAAAYKAAEIAYTKARRLDEALAIRSELEKQFGMITPKPPGTGNPQPVAGSPNFPAGTIDLMPFVDVEKDSVNGRWSRTLNGLTSDRGENTRLRIRYEPPQEYDFLMEFTRNEGDNSIAQLCWGFGHRFRWVLAGWERNDICGIDEVSHRPANDNATTVKLALENGRRYRSVVKVRKNEITCYLDDRRITTLRTDYKNLSYDAPGVDEGVLGLLTWGSTYTVHKLAVAEILGKGKRPAAVPSSAPSRRPSTAPLGTAQKPTAP